MDTIIDLESKKIKLNLNFLKTKKILITGATGLVGLYMTSFLKKEKNSEITCWINNPIPEYLKGVFKNCKIIQHDITDQTFVLPEQYDIIIHAAGYGQPLKFVKDKIKTIKINTEATSKLFNFLKKDGQFLFISSSEVYNGLELKKIKENLMGNTNSDHFRACYIEGKKCGEAICNAYAELGYHVKIARLSLAYGPGTKLNDERVFSTFIKKGLLNDKIDLIDGGEAIRTYCYIVDAVEMMLNVLFYGKHNIYNIGGSSITSILNLAKIVGNLLNKEVTTPNIGKPLQGNPQIVNIDCSRYIEEFNKTSYYDLEYGINKTIDWYKNLLEK
jgi:UDP-glucuronate decarboxylase